MKLKPWILPAECPQKIFIPLNAKIRMESTLHQHTGAPEGNRLIDFRANLIDGTDVSIGRARTAVESTEGTDDITDIRIVNVAIDDVCDDVFGMTTISDFVRRCTNPRDVV